VPFRPTADPNAETIVGAIPLVPEAAAAPVAAGAKSRPRKRKAA